MKILFDHQIFTSQRYGGISRYFFELITELGITKNIYTAIPLLISNNHYISDSRSFKHKKFFINREFKGKQRLMSLVNKLNMIYKIRNQNFDIFHPTYYDPYFLKHINNVPYVLTVHDMIHEKFSDMFTSSDTTSTNKRLLVEKATKIIAISESTKKDILEVYGIDESKIEVVYLGNSLLYNPDIIINIDIPQKYILFVGSRIGYKNFDRMVSAISKILIFDKELCLLCAGGGAFTSDEIDYFSDLNISGQIFQYDLNDANLAHFYRHAKLFVFPSLYEGFGIPVLEAFACNCPLVCSDTSSLPEIAGNAALYFNPYDEESIRSAILNVLNDIKISDRLVQYGNDRLKFFSWERTALQTNEIYRGILQ